MDIREALAAEHSKRQTMEIVDYICDDAKRFAELMSVFFEGEYRLTQRAAWPMSYVAIRRPQLIRPYLRRLVDQLERKDVHNAVRRNVVRLLEDIEIPSHLKGKVYSVCLELLDDISEPIAVRAFAMTVAAKIAKAEPDLLSELRLVIKTNTPNFSAALQSRARRVL